jgi:hypothetical protein
MIIGENRRLVLSMFSTRNVTNEPNYDEYYLLGSEAV